MFITQLCIKIYNNFRIYTTIIEEKVIIMQLFKLKVSTILLTNLKIRKKVLFKKNLPTMPIVNNY